MVIDSAGFLLTVTAPLPLVMGKQFFGPLQLGLGLEGLNLLSSLNLEE